MMNLRCRAVTALDCQSWVARGSCRKPGSLGRHSSAASSRSRAVSRYWGSWSICHGEKSVNSTLSIGIMSTDNAVIGWGAMGAVICQGAVPPSLLWSRYKWRRFEFAQQYWANSERVQTAGSTATSLMYSRLGSYAYSRCLLMDKGWFRPIYSTHYRTVYVVVSYVYRVIW